MKNYSYSKEISSTRNELESRGKAPYYEIERRESEDKRQESSHRSPSLWSRWKLPDDIDLYKETQTKRIEAATRVVEQRILKIQSLDPDVFLQTSDGGEIFRPKYFYGGQAERKSKAIGFIRDLLSEGLASDGSVPTSEIKSLTCIHEEAYEKLKECATNFQDHVLTPLRKILIACMLETYRDTIGFEKWESCGRRRRMNWRRLVHLVGRFMREGIAKGRLLKPVFKSDGTTEAWPQEEAERMLRRFPEAMAQGLRSALELHVEGPNFPEREEKKTNPEDHSRNAMLQRVDAVYFKWHVSRHMITSAVEDSELQLGGSTLRLRTEGVRSAESGSSTIGKGNVSNGRRLRKRLAETSLLGIDHFERGTDLRPETSGRPESEEAPPSQEKDEDLTLSEELSEGGNDMDDDPSVRKEMNLKDSRLQEAGPRLDGQETPESQEPLSSFETKRSLLTEEEKRELFSSSDISGKARIVIQAINEVDEERNLENMDNIKSLISISLRESSKPKSVHPESGRDSLAKGIDKEVYKKMWPTETKNGSSKANAVLEIARLYAEVL
jgi:hypothetical protein